MQTGIAVRRSITHGGIGQTVLILHTGPIAAAACAGIVFEQPSDAMPVAVGAMLYDILRMRMGGKQQHVPERCEQFEQSPAVGTAEGFGIVLGLEKGNMCGYHQQFVFVGTGQIARQKMELRFAQAADVGRLSTRPVDHIIEHDEVGVPFFPGEGIRTELGAEAFQ